MDQNMKRLNCVIGIHWNIFLMYTFLRTILINANKNPLKIIDSSKACTQKIFKLLK